MRGALDEQVLQQADAVGDVDPPVRLPVDEGDIASRSRRPVAAGKVRWSVEEQGAQDADGVGDVDPAVLVAVSRPLPAAERYRRAKGRGIHRSAADRDAVVLVGV